MTEYFKLKEAVASTALGHSRDCPCIICKAARGDVSAMVEILMERDIAVKK